MDNVKALSKPENLKYQLETLSSYEPADIDHPAFDVAYEGSGGNEGFATVCCIDVGKRSLKRINDLEVALQAYAKYGNKEAMERDIRLLNDGKN